MQPKCSFTQLSLPPHLSPFYLLENSIVPKAMGSLASDDGRTRLYIAGGPEGASLAPPVHEYIAKTMGRDWKMEFLQLETADQVMDVYRRADFRGGVITMPHKRAIIPFLDKVDEYVHALSACNFIYPDLKGQLCGTNTDWLGVRNAVLSAGAKHVSGQIAMVYGAGGAARAAVYALVQALESPQVYVINRDKTEVEELIHDVSTFISSEQPGIIHIESVEQASKLCTPQCIVCTVPDRVAATQSEIETKRILSSFLERGSTGLLIDMCYHPLTTTNLELARRNGWETVNGVAVVGHQLSTQWSFLGNGDIPKEAPALLQSLAEKQCP